MSESNMIPIGGLWASTAASGVKYLSGSLGFAKILIFRNERKEPGSNAPDYTMYIAPAKKREATTEQEGPDGVPF